MNVQELIERLNKIEDKTRTVSVISYYGFDCFSRCDNVGVKVEENVEDEGLLIKGPVVISGQETSNDGG